MFGAKTTRVRLFCCNPYHKTPCWLVSPLGQGWERGWWTITNCTNSNTVSKSSRVDNPKRNERLVQKPSCHQVFTTHSSPFVVFFWPSPQPSTGTRPGFFTPQLLPKLDTTQNTMYTWTNLTAQYAGCVVPNIAALDFLVMTPTPNPLAGLYHRPNPMGNEVKARVLQELVWAGLAHPMWKRRVDTVSDRHPESCSSPSRCPVHPSKWVPHFSPSLLQHTW